MKKVGAFLFLFVLLISLASFADASFVVHNYSIKDSYSSLENISGTINLTIIDEPFISKINSSQGGDSTLGYFLDANLASYVCSIIDCSSDYNYFSGEADKVFSVLQNEIIYGGFVLSGNNVFVTNLNFTIKSNFLESAKSPLSIDFFEGSLWNFNEFSEQFSDDLTGCYDPSEASPGPLIKASSYCEMISITSTGALNVGAYTDNGDDEDLKMVVYPGVGGFEIGSCQFDPINEGSCIIEADTGELFSKGDYQVCVEALSPTNYAIYTEEDNNTCGFVYSQGPESSVKDYGIFLQVAKYANSSFLDSKDLDFSNLATSADNLIDEKYGRDCSNECILPFAISGIPQNFEVLDLSLDYQKSGEDWVVSDIYDLNILPSLVNFSGVLDFSYLDFGVFESGIYSLYLGGEKLFDENFNVLSVPIVKSVSPLNPPAGVPIEFRADIDYNGNNNLTYSWDFGDGSKETTFENSVFHTYGKIKNYTLKLEVSVGNELSSEKKFNITSINPSFAISTTLSEKKDSLNTFSSKVDSLPKWYGEDLEKVAKLEFFNSELDRLEKDFNNSANDSELFAIAEDLYGLDVPEDLMSVGEFGDFLLDSSSDIKPSMIIEAEGADLQDNEQYKQLILEWQRLNILSDGSLQKHSIKYSNGESLEVLQTYKLNIISRSISDSYVAIDLPASSVSFKDDVARNVGEFFIVDLSSNGQKLIEFSSFEISEVPIFVSPKLSGIVLEDKIDTTCNYNSFCEEGLGENSKTCRSDCKPTKIAIVYVILAILLVLVVYTLLQIWYKKHYEKYLFGDSRSLYNILMYVTNAHAGGMTYKEISKNLHNQGWSNERINYVVNKAKGKKVGFYEIIPVEKIMSYFRNRSAKKSVNMGRNIATGNKQQFRRNINKY